MNRQRMIWLVPILLLALVGLPGGCGVSREGTSSQKVTLAMGFVPNVQFAPFYVALDKGYFAEEGIELEFDYGWETDLLKLVGSDELKFAIASGDQVILARSQGLPIVYIMNWYRRFPVCIVSLTETGIREPSDLVGLRVGTPALYGASYIGWRAFLDVVGIDEADVELISIGYTQVAALSERQVDAAICYAMNEPVQLQAAGQSVDIMYVADYANLVSNGLITNERTIRELPELVQGMVRATLRGLIYTLEYPDEAFDISLEHVPEAANDADTEAINRAILERSVESWRATPEELGLSDKVEWEIALEVMHRMGLVDGEGDVTTMFTNQFVVELKP